MLYKKSKYLNRRKKERNKNSLVLFKKPKPVVTNECILEVDDVIRSRRPTNHKWALGRETMRIDAEIRRYRVGRIVDPNLVEYNAMFELVVILVSKKINIWQIININDQKDLLYPYTHTFFTSTKTKIKSNQPE